MKIVLTGSLGQIGRHLAKKVIANGNEVTVISSNAARRADIEQLGAKAAIGSMFDPGFLTSVCKGADVVYLMETMEAAGDLFDKTVDFYSEINKIGSSYKQAVLDSGVKKVVHLSSIGAHTASGHGILRFHYNVEQILRSLPADVSIKFIRPVGFYTNLFSFIPTIKRTGSIISNYGGNKREPWVHPTDIAQVIAEELQEPFHGRTVRYVASDELSPNEIAEAFAKALGKPDLQWKVIPDEELLTNWLAIGFNKQVAEGFVELQASQGTGALYDDYYKNEPELGKVKLADFVKEFVEAYHRD